MRTSTGTTGRALLPGGASWLLCLLLLTPALWAQQEPDGPDSARAQRLRRALSHKAFAKSRIGVLVERLDSGRTVISANADKPLIPASLMKLVTSTVALDLLKPDYRFRTVVHGHGDLVGETFEGDLYLKGYGDPSLVDERIWLLARELKRKGIRKVSGALYTDASYFDREKFGNGWGPLTSNWYHAPLGALSVNFNTFRKNNRYHAISMDPEIYAGRRILEILEGCGLAIEKGVVSGKTVPEGSKVLYEHLSKSLGEITADLNKMSNNFVAEQILKTMGAELVGPPGTTSKGIALMDKYVTDTLGFVPASYRLEDGSGLSILNRLTARQFVTLLRATHRRFDIGFEFVSSLKIPGLEESKQDLFLDPVLQRRLRVKTGHLKGVDNLAGFAESKAGERYVFCLLVNGYRTGRYATDKAMEGFAKALVE